MLYNLLLPLKLDWLPLYSCEESLRVGQRVEVAFSGRQYTAVVMGTASDDAGKACKVSPVSAPLPMVADITEEELSLWRFIASYYLCTLGEVYGAAYPKYKIVSEKSKRKSQSADPVVECPAKPESLRASKPVLYESLDRIPYYVQMIHKALEEGFSALVLVPELEYTFILQDALNEEFKEKVHLYDSLITPAGKRKLAENLRKAEHPLVIVGTKSALFLPFRKLGVIIVDEEQDPSHKQIEPAPRYNARDVALVLGNIHSAQVILGSFTPSLESLYNCKIGKYSLVEGITTPPCKVELIDIPSEKRKRGMEGEYSKKLLLRLKKVSEGDIVTIIRSYQKEEEVKDFFATRFPSLDPQILTPFAAKHMVRQNFLTAVLRSDALFDRDDFRADEKALQALRGFASHTRNLLVQCVESSHPVYAAISDLSFEEALLSERKAFNMPPYSRLVDIKDKKTGQLVERKVLERGSQLEREKSRLRLQYGALYIIDVDPL